MNPAYLLSLPERLVRAAAAMLGGAIYEITRVTLPRWLRRSQLYQALVERLLRIIIEFIGGVRDVFPPSASAPAELATRKVAGNVVEFAGFLAMGLSPLWLLAAVADVSGGARTYLHALEEELCAQGVLQRGENIHTFEALLNTLSDTTGLLASSVDMPPVQRKQLSASLADMRACWRVLQARTAALPAPATLAGIFSQMQETARRERKSLLEVSQQIAAGAVRAGFRIGQVHIFDYYAEALSAIAAEGLSAYSRRAYRPYLVVALRHFDPVRSTFSERTLRRLLPATRYP